MPDDAAAFCAREYSRLVRGPSLHVGDRFLAESLAQEALLRACRRWEHVRELEAPGGWTWRVALNLANSGFRRQRVARRAQSRLQDRHQAVHHDADSADTIAVRAAVAALPRRQRSAIVLRYFLDLPVADAAAAMGCSSDAVRSLTKRAVAALRDVLAEPAAPDAAEDSRVTNEDRRTR